jgi:predicted RNA-binding Zn-ribbon protein involved in translation (DUF1610 family)
MAHSKSSTVSTTLECPDCGNHQKIRRITGRQHKKKHVKHMYCYKCKEVTGHIEVKEDPELPEWLREFNEGDE